MVIESAPRPGPPPPPDSWDHPPRRRRTGQPHPAGLGRRRQESSRVELQAHRAAPPPPARTRSRQRALGDAGVVPSAAASRPAARPRACQPAPPRPVAAADPSVEPVVPAAAMTVVAAAAQDRSGPQVPFKVAASACPIVSVSACTRRMRRERRKQAHQRGERRGASRPDSHRENQPRQVWKATGQLSYGPRMETTGTIRPAADWRGRRVQGHPLRDRGGHREDHDQPPRGAQRVPARDADRAVRRVRARARGHRRRRDRAHRRGPDGVLLGRRPAHPRRRRLHRRRRTRGVGRLNVLDLQVQIRRLPKPVVAMVAGYAIGGGHVLHVVCDLTIAADNARFGQTGPKVGSFDGGYGAGLLARIVGHKKAREIWFLCRQYDAAAGARDGPRQHGRAARASSRRRPCSGAARCSQLSPLALRLLKASFNADQDGLAGIQQLAGDATMLFYMTEEAPGGPRRLPREARARLRASSREAAVDASRSAAALADGRAAAHAAGRDRARARRHRAGRLRGHLPPARVRRRAASAASSSRSARTSRTTTRTPAAAPTPRSGSARCG